MRLIDDRDRPLGPPSDLTLTVHTLATTQRVVISRIGTADRLERHFPLATDLTPELRRRLLYDADRALPRAGKAPRTGIRAWRAPAAA